MSGSPRRQEILDVAADLLASAGSRTSVTDIAEACGIRAGSLYHHFESKDAIIGELVARYRRDLDAVAVASLTGAASIGSGDVEAEVIALGRAIAHGAQRHRAALLLTLDEPWVAADGGVGDGTTGPGAAVDAAMLAVLDRGAGNGRLRPEVDRRLLADRLTQAMLRHSVGPSYLRPDAEAVLSLRCRVLLDGLAVAVPPDADLDGSVAMATARDVVASWPGPVDDRAGRISAAARAEFGRRGFEAATMRDIAAAAGLAPQAVYRLFPSKEELFATVMESYREERQAGWDAVLGSKSSSVEKLDALAWLNISLMQQFRDELRIQLAWMRESTPNIRSLLSTEAQRRDILGLVEAGTRRGELAFDAGGVERWTTFVYEALWTPETVVRSGGTAAAHALARQTVLRGALVRS